MEILLVGLTILGGVALLLQQKVLPSKAEAEKASEALDRNPTDPDANTLFGKYKAFVIGDYEGAMPYLVHSKDQTLKALAEHELDASYTATAQQKVGMGDEWVSAAKKSPALSRIFYDRAAEWYVMAWPDLDEVWKRKSRDQAKKLSASRPAGGARNELPSGWTADPPVAATNPPITDGTFARSGSYSLKLPSVSEKAKGGGNIVRTGLIPAAGKAMEVTAFIRSDGTESASDIMFVLPFNQAGAQMLPIKAFLKNDLPFWHPTIIKTDLPKDVARVQLGFANYSKNGVIWIDDVSVKFDGKETLKNGSFEEK